MGEMKEGQGLIINLAEKQAADLLKLKLTAVLEMVLLAKQILKKCINKKIEIPKKHIKILL